MQITLNDSRVIAAPPPRASLNAFWPQRTAHSRHLYDQQMRLLADEGVWRKPVLIDRRSTHGHTPAWTSEKCPRIAGSTHAVSKPTRSRRSTTMTSCALPRIQI